MSVDPGQLLNIYWDSVIRIEPTSRFSWDVSPKLSARALRAEIHDPLWTLHRQWQVGEFRGEDAATPASVSLQTQSIPLTRWWPGSQAAGGGHALNPSGMPVEAAVTGEPFPLDTRMRVELGRLLLTVIADAAPPNPAEREALIARARQMLIALAPMPETADDARAARLLRAARTTVPNGGTLWSRRETLAAEMSTIPGANWISVVETWRGAAARTLGLDAGARSQPADPVQPLASPSWDVARLDHRAVLGSAGAPAARIELLADPDADGALDWYAFDRATAQPEAAWAAAATTQQVGIPGRVRIPGMPSPRWWDFEDSAHSLVALDMDVGDSEADARNHHAAKLAWLDFQLVHGLDWFMIAVDAPIGSVCRVDTLNVTDVFGLVHPIKPADAEQGERRWSMFRNGPAERRMLVVASTAAHHESGPWLEQVRLARDEQSNLVWAIPIFAPDDVGCGRRLDRESVERISEKVLYRSEQQPPRLSYTRRSDIPRHWIPFIPMWIRPGSEQVRLQRAAVAGDDGRRHSAKPTPILATAPGEPLYLREESIPRGGLRIYRRPIRARDVCGRTWVWVQRGSEVGTGEVASGLRHDLAVSERSVDD